MNFLFVNACMRGEDSRTLRLCLDYIEKFKKAKAGESWSFAEVDLDAADIEPLNRERLAHRDALARSRKWDDEEFALARQIIAADHILIGAPYWDLSFPSKLKVYLERCSVTGLTFIYSPEGIPHGQCRAQSLSYVTTAGSAIRDFNFGYEYVRGLCALFGIEKIFFASAEELDIIGKDVPAIMAAAEDKITAIIDSL